MSTATEFKSLNLGCGTAKIEGSLNVDCNEGVKPDVCFDISGPFPLENNTYHEVYFFHCIEHLEKRKHRGVLTEIHRVMKMGGILYISYPEFEQIIRNWLSNKDNNRKFWEATIYGRQLYSGDYHFSAITTLDLKQLLADVGFNVIKEFTEPTQPFNTVLWCERGEATPSYEDVLLKEVFRQ